LLAMGLDPVWLGIMIAINLQTSFLTPPFGFALFYLRGVAPASVTTAQIYRGVIPFVAIQLLALLVLALVPELATWLPQQIYSH
jgi:TRAP-type mannitol/chloroaromatic compound transport system permease large subunit